MSTANTFSSLGPMLKEEYDYPKPKRFQKLKEKLKSPPKPKKQPKPE